MGHEVLAEGVGGLQLLANVVFCKVERDLVQLLGLQAAGAALLNAAQHLEALKGEDFKVLELGMGGGGEG